LKPSIHKNEVLARLGSDHYKLFTGLLGLADRKGRLVDRPERIEAEIFPFKFQQVDVNKMLDELAECSEHFVLRYEKGGQRCIQIINFLKHNYPHIREAESTIPAPDKHGASTRKDRPLPSSLTPLPSTLLEASVVSALPYERPDKIKDPTGFLVMTYKEGLGVPFDDRPWDKQFWGRWSREAKVILDSLGRIDDAVSYLKFQAKQLSGKGLDWTLKTVANRAVLYAAKKRGKNDTSSRKRISGGDSEPRADQESSGLRTLPSGGAILDAVRGIKEL